MTESKSALREVGGDFVRVHRIITRALQVTADRSASFARTGYPGARDGEGFGLYVRSLATLLHGHHITEDDVAFPYFRSVIPEAPFDRMSAQHRHMVPTMVLFLLYNMTSEDRTIMAKGILGLAGGLSVRLLWRRDWKAMSPFLLS